LNCGYCGNSAVSNCSVCGRPVCNAHTRQRITCPACIKKRRVEYVVEKIRAEDLADDVKKVIMEFWGEERQLTFGRELDPVGCAAYYGKVGNSVVGVISLAEHRDDLIIVALGVCIEYQRSGIGSGLVEKAELEARRLGKNQLLVSTSNDNLPALGFYQALGFQIFEVVPGVLARKHGKILAGIGGLPVRDELRLQKTLS
jgi:ribosomal protein S18 acetylase RimI-like enzyme